MLKHLALLTASAGHVAMAINPHAHLGPRSPCGEPTTTKTIFVTESGALADATGDANGHITHKSARFDDGMYHPSAKFDDGMYHPSGAQPNNDDAVVVVVDETTAAASSVPPVTTAASVPAVSSAAASGTPASSTAAATIDDTTNDDTVKNNDDGTDDTDTDTDHDATGGQTTSGGLTNAVYFINWGIYGAYDFKPMDLKTDDITHVIYAFLVIDSDGSVISHDTYADEEIHFEGDSWDTKRDSSNVYGCVKQLYLHKQKNRNLKTLLSIGGWTASQEGAFKAASSTPTGRQNFATSAVKFLADWGFDGIDIDWEYPSDATEAQNFVELLKTTREELDKYGKEAGDNYHYLLTIASPAGKSHYSVLDMAAMDKYLDLWNLMAYDYAGTWDDTTGLLANLYHDETDAAATKFDTDSTVKDYVSAGVTPSKLNLGLPLYGRAFMSAEGLGKSYSKGTPQGSIEGVYMYHELPRNGAQETFLEQPVAVYSYDEASKELVSYDDVRSTGVKANYILDHGLGGAFFWEASGDRTGQDSLVSTMADGLGGLAQSQNQLNYPKSKYTNIRNGMKE